MSISLDLSKNKGIVLDLAKLAPELKHLKAHMTWGMHPVHGKSMKDGFDLDLFVFALNQSGKITFPQDVVYYNNQKLAGDAVVLPADNRDGDGDGEEVMFNLDNVPSDKSQLDLYVFLFDFEARKQNFGMMAGAKVDLINQDDGKILQSYALNEDYSQDTALHVGSLVRSGSGWSFKAEGVGARATPNDIIPAYQ